MKKEKIDIICLQETLKQDFADHELRSLEIGDRFHWSWLSASGHSSGMLLGFKLGTDSTGVGCLRLVTLDSTIKVGSIDQGDTLSVPWCTTKLPSSNSSTLVFMTLLIMLSPVSS
jgi:hypothetical protein